MHQTTGAVALVATDRSGRRGAITMVEPAQLRMMQGRLHRRRRDTELVADVVSAAPVPGAQPHDPTLDDQAGLIR